MYQDAGTRAIATPAPHRNLRARSSTRSFARARWASFAHQADFVFQRDAELGVDALAGHVHQCEHVGRGGAAAVDDEVRVLRRDLRAAQPFALEADLLDQAPGEIAGRVLPDAAGRRERQRLRRLLVLQARLDVLLDLGLRPAVEPEAAADQDRPV